MAFGRVTADHSVTTSITAPSTSHPLEAREEETTLEARFDGEEPASDASEDDGPAKPPKNAENDMPIYVNRTTNGVRKRRRAIFAAWLKDRNNQKNMDNAVKKMREEKSGVAEELMSTKALIAQRTSPIISQPREYQLELFELAKKQNILAVLGTGSGKTLIACLLIRHMVNEELEARQRGESRRVSIFLADSVALCFQQTAVLECNIDAKVGKFHGSNSIDMTREAWAKVLDEYQVLVMTADVLYNCLTHAMMAMKDINLICFDEAHRAKKSHVYARIIRDFYVSELEKRRPKIFGMTASPVDSQEDIEYAARELERLMHCRIATTSDLALLQHSVNKPHEQIIPYEVNQRLAQIGAPLFCLLKEKYEKVKVFKKLFAFSTWARVQLGPWFADYVWTFALSELETQKLKRKLQKMASRQMTTVEIANLDDEIELIREAQQVVANHEIPPPVFAEASPKVRLLAVHLFKTYKESDNTRCLVFVTRRHTARCLKGFFDRIRPPFLHHDILIGTGESGSADKFSFRQQMLSVIHFKYGRLNCLFSTSVAEEGLDIPDCNLVIRFDLYSNMIQYIQSRGRARHSNSRYIHMIEKNNPDHSHMVLKSKDAENVMKDFCSKLPEDRLLDKHGIELEDLDSLEGLYTYVEPSTGAKMTMNSAMKIIAHFCDHLSSDSEESNHPTYIVGRIDDRKYVCELLLPPNSPLSHFEGQAMPSKPMAKRVVAFEACVQLRKGGYLNEHLLPIYIEKSAPAGANAKLAVNNNKKSVYELCLKPSFWDIEDGRRPDKLWLTFLKLDQPQRITDGKNFHHIALLSRKKLPQMPSFTIYGDSGYDSTVHLVRLDDPIQITDEIMDLFQGFSERSFHDVFNKKFEWELETTPYWLAPLTQGNHTNDTSPHDCIDWGALKYVTSALRLDWDANTSVEIFEEKFLIDHFQRSRRFAAHGFDAILHPDDPIPAGVATAPGIETIKDYSYNAGHKGRKYRWVDEKDIPENQPVLIASRVFHRLDYLDPPAERDVVANKKAYICPSAFHVSMLSMGLVRSIMCFPAISWRIDSYLQAWDVCKITGLELDLGVTLEAITKDSDNTDNHNAEQINKQRGMGANYERLEFLGDCYLKLGTTISLFTHEPGDDEYHLHVARMQLVCNANLFKNARALDIPKHIQAQGFSRRTWYPKMKLLHGKGVGKEISHSSNHRLGDKSIADVCEALIGAALIDKGLDGATQMTTAILCGEIHTQNCWEDYYKAYVVPEYQKKDPSASQVRLVNEIEKQLGYRFKSPRLLMSAFTHPSNPYSFEKVPNYQRLEFLGDALLDLTCVRFIFDCNPTADPQWMTEHKMAMVSNKFLSAVCVELGFHKRLRACSPQIGVRNAEYALEIEELKQKNPRVDYWVGIQTKPPKELADILEAYIGAIFVDSHFNFAVVQDFFDAHIKPYFIDMSLYDDFAGQHPTTFLTKELTRRGCLDWGYENKQFGEGENSFVLAAILIHDDVFEYETADSVKTAKSAASMKALERLENLADGEFEKICNCRAMQLKMEEMGEVEKKFEIVRKVNEDGATMLARVEVSGGGGKTYNGTGQAVAAKGA